MKNKNKDKIDDLRSAIIKLFKNIKFKQFFTLNEIITLKIINFFYWVLLLLTLLIALKKFFCGNFLSAIFTILIFSILARIACEFIIVIFKISEALGDKDISSRD